MNRWIDKEIDTHELSPLTLALIGDGVYELMVREMLVCEANRSANDLHKASVKLVRAEAQAAAMDKLEPLLTEQEAAVFRRGRNTRTPRNDAAYHRATGFEALFGYLYMNGEMDRIKEFFEICMKA